MAICKSEDGWQVSYACCNKNGLLGYRGQTQEPIRCRLSWRT